MPVLNRFWLYSGSWHVAVNSTVRHTMHGMGGHDVGVHDADVHSIGVLSMGCTAWTCLA
jgi:hypothetical protein